MTQATGQSSLAGRAVAALVASFALLGVPFAAPAAARAKSTPTVDFSRDIRPILSENCFACHGPDEAALKGKLRLDLPEEALKPAKSGEVAIVPGDPAKSELIRRITTTDPDDVMPPPKSDKKLTGEQIEKLRTWIAEGAPYRVHWAFATPQRLLVPLVKNKRWVRHELDAFVLARQEHEGLAPSPEADRTTLIRRASLDLTGLPPTIEEVDAFLADKSPKAYEMLVDRLLDSPRYGEHMAKYWLDAARYADSHGYHIDSQRDIWAYRDWVVNAFNANKPFDQFTTEQLAGDLLPNATTEQKIASGYVRCNMSTGEGGVIEAEYAAKYAFDRVETTGTMWLGLTLVCARCHTHKYDPITQKEYYGLYAFFNQLEEPVMDGNKPNPDPFIKLPSKEQSERLAWLKQHIAEGQAKVDGPAPELDSAQGQWLKQWHERLRGGWAALQPTATTVSAATTKVETPFGAVNLEAAPKADEASTAQLTVLEDKSLLASGPKPEKDVYRLTLRPKAGALAALRLETLPHDSLPQKAAGRANDGKFHLSEFEAELVPPSTDGKQPEPQKLKFTHALADVAEGDNRLERAIDGKADTAWSVDAKAATEPHTALFLLAEPVKVPDNAELRIRLRFEDAKDKGALGHFRLSVAQDDEFVRLLNPPRFESWQLIGPFKTDGLRAGFDKAFEPEQEIDLKKSYPGVREEVKWSARGDLADGKTHLLVHDLHGVHGAYYFYRVVHAPTPTKLELSLRADDLFKLWVNDQLLLERADPEQDKGVSSKVAVELKQGENRILVKVVNHQGAKYFAFNHALAGPESFTPDIAAIVSVTTQPVGDWAERVRNFYRRQHSTEFKELFDNLVKWREEETAIDREIPTTMVAKELTDKMRDTLLLKRGEYDKPGEKVQAGVPAVLIPFPKDAPMNRLGLAKWLLDPSHPLTARVTVNRLWQQVFGVGLVKTAEDFGVQGERPSHPELLDWLATEFIRSGWDVKHMMRLLVTSATYRQTSRASPELRAKDPENRLLARGPRFRVDGEVVRDTALYLGGLLLDKRGGRSVKPYEPPGLWEAVSFNNSQKYVQDLGEANYRRSLYTHWKRQSPPPNMLIFDAPTREYCIARRPRTNTPLQALTLLNDPQFVEASRAFAQRILLEGGDTVESRIAYAFRLATGRKPARDEVRVIRETLDKQLAAYRTDDAAAKKLLAVGSFNAKPELDARELAAWTTIASMILNLDETITKG
jgi:mono/diheme cytochrome c family protein